ncbi:Transcriptional regulator, MarR family [Methanocaldococcus lauensis]|uniref:Transcriptional regulator, MarR family n=1 Tax=Methanocaldococcus lauensis TaxID=2546128 RepID=A0A8D6PST2_9EURY|nr:Transcriptional regulator, MarR family [Methanocaldococcus lauensis]
MTIKTKLIMSLFLLLLLVDVSLGYVIKETNIECIVNPDNTINETITLLIYNDKDENLSSITFTIPQNVKNYTIYSPNGIKGYSILYEEGATTFGLEFDKPVPPRKYTNITFNLLVSDAVWIKNDIYQLIMSFPISSKNATIEVILPPGAVISSYQGNLFVTPSGYKITTDGKHQIIVWNLNLNKEITFTIAVKYTFVKFPTQNIIETNNILTNSNLKYTLILLMLSILIFGGLFIRENRSKKKILEKNISIINELEKLKKLLKNKDEEILKLNNMINELKEELNRANRNILSKDEIISVLNDKVSEYKSELDKLINENQKYLEEINYLNELVKKLKNENKKLKEKVEELNKVVEEYQNLKKGVLWDFLTEDEKIIIDLIKKYGHITQKELVEITKMSKPKVSRIVSELEDRKIIKKEKIGRINKLTLTEESKKLL